MREWEEIDSPEPHKADSSLTKASLPVNVYDELGVLQKGFFKYGKFVSRHPVVVIGVAIAVLVGFSFGMVNLDVESDPQKIWVPPGSVSAIQQDNFNKAFEPFYRIEQIIFLDRHTPGKNVINQDNLLSMLELQEKIENGVSSSGYKLSDFCFRPIKDQGCIIESPLNYWKSNATTIKMSSQECLEDAVACRWCSDLDTDTLGTACLAKIGAPAMQPVILGGTKCAKYDPCGTCDVLTAEAGMMTFLLENHPEKKAMAEEWEKDVFLKYASEYNDNTGNPLSASYMSQVSSHTALIARKCVMMCDLPLVFAALSSGFVASCRETKPICGHCFLPCHVWLHCCCSRALPFPVGVKSSIGASGCNHGRWLRYGSHRLRFNGEYLHHNDCQRSCPVPGTRHRRGKFISVVDDLWVFDTFLQDNMFIIVKARDRFVKRFSSSSREETIGAVLAEVGPSITSAALCEFLGRCKSRFFTVPYDIRFLIHCPSPAFAVGAATDIPALKSFCFVAAAAVFFNYAMQMTWFTGAMTLDHIRMRVCLLGVASCLRSHVRLLFPREGGLIAPPACAQPALGTTNAASDGPLCVLAASMFADAWTNCKFMYRGMCFRC